MKTDTKPTENTAENGNKSKPLLGDSSLCSGCNNKERTVNRNMFDGLCADCTTKALYDYDFAKKAQIRNEELKGPFAQRFAAIRGCCRIKNRPHKHKLNYKIMTKISKNAKSQQSCITAVISRFFWNGMWQNFLLIGVVEMVAQFILRYLANDYTSYKILHFIAWTFWSIFCLIKVVRFNRQNGL